MIKKKKAQKAKWCKRRSKKKKKKKKGATNEAREVREGGLKGGRRKGTHLSASSPEEEGEERHP